MKTDPDDQAFPSQARGDGNRFMAPARPGMTKREAFAAMAMHGLAPHLAVDHTTRRAIEYADALIDALNASEGEDK